MSLILLQKKKKKWLQAILQTNNEFLFWTVQQMRESTGSYKVRPEMRFSRTSLSWWPLSAVPAAINAMSIKNLEHQRRLLEHRDYNDDEWFVTFSVFYITYSAGGTLTMLLFLYADNKPAS